MSKLQSMNLLHKNNGVKVVILSIIATCFCVGILLIKRMNEEKKSLSIHLFSFVPAQVHVFVYAKELRLITASANFTERYKELFSMLSRFSKPAPSLILCKQSDYVICQKISRQQEDMLKSTLLPRQFSAYPPKIMRLEGTDYYFFSAPDSTFFVSAFVDGTFLGSYNFEILKSAVDSRKLGEGLRCKQLIRQEIETYYEKGNAVFVSREREYLTVFTSQLIDGKNKLTGFQERKLAFLPGKRISINYALFPDSLYAVQCTGKIDSPLDSSLLKATLGVEYHYFTSSKTYGNSQIDMIPLQPGIALTDSINPKVKGRPFLSFFGQYYLHDATLLRKGRKGKCLAGLFWTQWHSYLLISPDVEAVVRYVKRKETKKDKMDYSFLKKYAQNGCNELFYSENSTTEGFHFISPEMKKLLGAENKRAIYSCWDNPHRQTFEALFFEASK